MLFIQSVSAFFLTLALITVLSRVAPRLGLTDSPDSRKHHDGDIPLVGGISIIVTLIAAATAWSGSTSSLISDDDQRSLWIFLYCASALSVIGALDDRFKLGVSIRILAEVLIAMLVTEFLDLRLAQLGDLFGNGKILLPPVLAYPFTVLFIFGGINAFNMLDGLDGLLASLVLSNLALFYFTINQTPGLISLVIASSLLAFLVSNLNLLKLVPKTFLGDSGSRLLGFVVVCLLISATSNQVGGKQLIKPVTTLYLIALPAFDLVFVVARRILKNLSPFSADRSHIHHLLQELGFSSKRALVIIIFLNIWLSSLGLILHFANVAETFQLIIFLSAFVLYALLVSQAWLLTSH